MKAAGKLCFVACWRHSAERFREARAEWISASISPRFSIQGRENPLVFKHVVRQPPFRIFERVLIQMEWLALAGQVVKLAILDCAADLLISVGHG